MHETCGPRHYHIGQAEAMHIGHQRLVGAHCPALCAATGDHGGDYFYSHADDEVERHMVA